MSRCYYDGYNKAIKFSGADRSTVENLLNTISKPEHNHTRWGSGDKILRQATADALQDQGRDEEAALLRGDDHVIVQQGKVTKGQFVAHRVVGGLQQIAKDHNNTYHAPSSFQYRVTPGDEGKLKWIRTPPYGSPVESHHTSEELNSRLADDLEGELGSELDGDRISPDGEEPARGLIEHLRTAPLEEPGE